jgi:hypothetical protein
VAEPRLIEGVDYYMEGDNLVFTRHYLLRRGYCCNSGCRHCPYGDTPAPPIGISIVGAAKDDEES